jgi:hypothetical protein
MYYQQDEVEYLTVIIKDFQILNYPQLSYNRLTSCEQQDNIFMNFFLKNNLY